MKPLFKWLAAAGLALSMNSASAVVVDTALSLVIDVSGSVSTSEYNLQMDGYGAAFRDASVQNNILGGTNGKIAVNAVFFASSVFATTLETFTILDSATAIDNFATLLEGFARPGSGGTVISAGMNRATSLLQTATGVGGTLEGTTNLVMDVSGDGGSAISTTQAARNAAAAAGITVNGLPIGSTSISNFYRDNVITTDGFFEPAASFNDFNTAVVKKLRVETGGGVPVPAPLLLMGLGLVSLRLRKYFA